MKLALGKFLLLFGLLIIFNSTQAQQHEWAKAIKSVDSSNLIIGALNLNSDTKGNVYASGPFRGIFDFDPNNGSKVDSSNSSSYLNNYTVELDSNGNYKWHQVINTDNIVSYAGHIDYKDNYFTSGTTYKDSVKVGDTAIHLNQSLSSGPYAYLIKYTSSKEVQWSINLQAYTFISIFEIESDDKNNIYLSGLVNGHKDSVDMDPSPTSQHKIYSENSSYYILKLDSNANFQWVKTFQCCFITTGVNQSSQLFSYSILSDTIINTPNRPDTINLNYTDKKKFSRINSNNGNELWEIPVYSNSPITFPYYPYDVRLPTDALGNVYLFGTFADSLFIGTSPQQSFISKGSRDGFISKFDSIGNLVWLRQFDGQLDNFKSVTINDSGNFFIGTELYGKYNFPTDSGQLSYYASPEKRMTLIKFKTNGNFDWAKPIEAGVGSQIEAIDWSRATNSIYSTGNYNQKLIAGDTLSTNNKYDLFITKTKLCDPIPFYDTLYLCAGDSSYIPNLKTEHAGNYSQLVENSSGCDSIRYTHLVVYPSYPDTSVYSFCEGDSLLYQGNYYSKDTLFRYPASTVQGCDSSRVVLIQSDTATVTEFIGQICEADTFYFNNQEYFQSGTYFDTLQAISGCDSILKLHLTVNPKSYFQQNISICEGEVYQIGNSNYKKSGSYTDTLINNLNCDSIVTTFLSVDTLPINEQHITICEGGSYSIGFSTYTQAGTYSDTLYRFNDCDSVVITHLSLTQKEDSTINITLCEGESRRINNQTYSRSGNYTQYLNFGGCQITLNINVEVLPKKSSTQSFALCVGDSVQVGNQVYSESGTYTNTLQASNGCDSLVTTEISIPEFDIILNENSLNVFPKESYENVRYLWYNCDSKRVLYDETDKRFEFKLNGHYAPIVILDNCRDTLICNQVTYNGDYKLKVFPNPAKDVCTIVVPTAGKMKLYTSNGRLVHEYYFSRSREYIYQIPETAIGLYFVVFEGEEGILTEKLSIVD